MQFDLVVKVIKNPYGVIKGCIFTANSESGNKYLNEHWSINGNEVVNPVAAKMWLKHMAENDLKVEIPYEMED